MVHVGHFIQLLCRDPFQVFMFPFAVPTYPAIPVDVAQCCCRVVVTARPHPDTTHNVV